MREVIVAIRQAIKEIVRGHTIECERTNTADDADISIQM
jgi:hypothetical protein